MQGVKCKGEKREERKFLHYRGKFTAIFHISKSIFSFFTEFFFFTETSIFLTETFEHFVRMIVVCENV